MAEDRRWVLVSGPTASDGSAAENVLAELARLHSELVYFIAPESRLAQERMLQGARVVRLPEEGDRQSLLRSLVRALREARPHIFCVSSDADLGWIAKALKRLLGRKLVVISDHPGASDLPADLLIEFEEMNAADLSSKNWQGRAQAVARMIRQTEGNGPIEADYRLAPDLGVALLPTHDLKAPLLTVIVDTEEEFDWGAPVSSQFTEVFATQEIWRFQDICDAADIRPTYVLDYPVAVQDHSARIFRELSEGGRAEIGAHLHAWVTPPFDKVTTNLDSYQSNLDPALERAKLELLTKTVEQQIGVRPKIHKAGRYGIGAETVRNLRALDYRIDLSPSTGFDFRGDGGPDFTSHSGQPYWFRQAGLFCLPTSGAVVGKTPWLDGMLRRFEAFDDQEHFLRFSPWSILADRVRLSPEGNSAETMKLLARSLIARGIKVLSLSLHSTSLAPHTNPYATDESDVKRMLEACAEFFRYFREELGGEIITPYEIRDALGVAD